MEDPITNAGTPAPKAFGFTDKSPHGDDDAIPVLPLFKESKAFPEAKSVEEAFKGTDTDNPELTVEEAEEMNPPVSVERLLTNNVEEAFKAPAT